MRLYPLFPKKVQVMMVVSSLGFGLYGAGCCSWDVARQMPAVMPESIPEASQIPEVSQSGEDAPLTARELTGELDEPAPVVSTPVSDSAMPAPVSTPVSDSATPAPVSSAPASAGDTSPGYRVQVYSFTGLDAAETALKRVQGYLSDWSHRVHMDEEDGSFKIRVGDFTDKADADRLRDRLRQEGYPDAWTVTAQIQTP